MPLTNFSKLSKKLLNPGGDIKEEYLLIIQGLFFLLCHQRFMADA